ncbi:MAG: DUF3137 domain-containing protein [Pseudomonadota bacterium]
MSDNGPAEGSGNMTTKGLSLNELSDRLRPTVDALETERRSVLSATIMRAAIGAGGGALLAVILALFGLSLLIPIILLLGGAIIGFVLAMGRVKAFKDRAAETLAAPVVEAIGDVEYTRSPVNVLDAETFFSLNLVSRGNQQFYADRLSGRYRETDFMLVECKTRRRSRSRTGQRTGSTTSSKTLFVGLLVKISVPVEFGGTVFIGQDYGKLGNMLGGMVAKFSGDLKPVEFPESQFEQSYQVYSDNPETAYRLISEEFAKTMVQFVSVARGGRPRAAFANGSFLLALPWRGGFMEPVKMLQPIALTPEWLQEIVDEVTLPHQLIDILHGDGGANP